MQVFSLVYNIFNLTVALWSDQKPRITPNFDTILLNFKNGSTMNYNKIKSTCRVVRIVLGLGLIATGFITGNAWFYLGIAPLIAGIVNFCPLCLITKKCTI